MKKMFIRFLFVFLFYILSHLLMKYIFIYDVYALGISSSDTGSVVQVIDNTTQEIQHNVIGHPWFNWGTGYLYFDFSLMKVNGTATSANVYPRSATATSGGVGYLCTIGSSSVTNSTFNNMVFSAKCPMTMASDGLTNISIQFQDFQSNAPSDYRFVMGGIKTFEQVVGGSFDSSGITSSISSQITNDNNNTQQIIDSQDNTTAAINDVNDSIQDVHDVINNDDVTDATDSGNDFFENFQINGHGLSNFITMPFRLIQSFTTQTCTPLQFQLPFVHNVVTIPCFRPIIQQHFPTILALFQLITTGLICYRVCINTFSIVKRLQNPTDDRIEVLSL